MSLNDQEAELLIQEMSSLDLTSLPRTGLCLTSPQAKEICNEDQFWTEKIKREFPEFPISSETDLRETFHLLSQKNLAAAIEGARHDIVSYFLERERPYHNPFLSVCRSVDEVQHLLVRGDVEELEAIYKLLGERFPKDLVDRELLSLFGEGAGDDIIAGVAWLLSKELVDENGLANASAIVDDVELLKTINCLPDYRYQEYAFTINTEEYIEALISLGAEEERY